MKTFINLIKMCIAHHRTEGCYRSSCVNISDLSDDAPCLSSEQLK